MEDAIKRYRKAVSRKLIEQKKSSSMRSSALCSTPKEKLTKKSRSCKRTRETRSTLRGTMCSAQLSPADREKRTALRKQLHDDQSRYSAASTLRLRVVNNEKPHETNVLKVGDHRMKLGTVTPGVPVVLSAAFERKCRRLDGAAAALWPNGSLDPHHPLTARVIVNRIWQFRMGRGIVGTPNDFGTLGERPTHPELLDWLASEFVRSSWSVKALDRKIVLSSTYRQAATAMRANRQSMRQQALLADEPAAAGRRSHPRCVLSVSGMLNGKTGGPPIRTPIEKEIYDIIFTEYGAR